MNLLLTCEHASNRVPRRYARLFQGQGGILDTHRAWDPGARQLARRLASELQVTLIEGRLSRLLIELNRSLHHAQLWSEYSRELKREERRRLIREVYSPYREAVKTRLADLTKRRQRALHVGVHTFTPVLDGVARSADVGLLYDPGRPRETTVALLWQTALRKAVPGLRVRRNYPYRGKADGLVTWLRGEFDSAVYLGIELEVNQRFPLGPQGDWRTLRAALAGSLAETLAAPVQL